MEIKANLATESAEHRANMLNLVEALLSESAHGALVMGDGLGHVGRWVGTTVRVATWNHSNGASTENKESEEEQNSTHF